MQAKLREVKAEVTRRRHDPIPEQGAWLAGVVRGYFAYHAIPTNVRVMAPCRTRVIRHWHRALRRRPNEIGPTGGWSTASRTDDSHWQHDSSIRGRSSGLTVGPEAKAQCVSRARWDLSGGRPKHSRRGPFLPRPIQAAMTAQLVSDALAVAVWRRGRPNVLLHRSDQGSQYTSEAFQRVLHTLGAQSRRSRASNVWDNSVIERFFSTLRTERTARSHRLARDLARTRSFDFIERFYNSIRRHSILDFVGPADFEQGAA